MKALLLVAHGSRRQASNDEIKALADRLNQQTGTDYDFARCAFLELAEPSIPQGIEQCIQHGAHEVVVLPYFLSAGRHVVEDIPAEVETKQQEHPNVSIRLTPYIGASDNMTELLREAAG